MRENQNKTKTCDFVLLSSLDNEDGKSVIVYKFSQKWRCMPSFGIWLGTMPELDTNSFCSWKEGGWPTSLRHKTATNLISLRLRFRGNCLSTLHPNLVSSPIKGILEILNLDILAWTDCVRSRLKSQVQVRFHKYQYFCRFELENMSIYEILPALDLTQSVYAKISIGVHRGVKFKISRIPLIGLETRLGWRTDRKFLRSPNLNEITTNQIK